MFTIVGSKLGPFCDGITRRNFLRIGATGLAGLSLPDVLRAEAQAGKGRSSKSFILIQLQGGSGAHDTIDHKPDAPEKCRGPFKSIPTNVPGMHVGEYMKKLSRMADKWTGIRSLVGNSFVHDHEAVWCGIGDALKQKRAFGNQGAPAIGSVIAKLCEKSQGNFPAYFGTVKINSALGPFYDTPYQSNLPELNLTTVSSARLRRRQDLLNGIDNIRRDIDESGMMNAMDKYSQGALELVTSGKLAQTLDLTKEDPKTLENYVGENKNRKGPMGRGSLMESAREFIRARRLIEAGARCVGIHSGCNWDAHYNYVNHVEPNVTHMDHLLSSLIHDLDVRGMLDDVMILVWGEIGNPPFIDEKNNNSRAHWGRVCPAIVAGGGLKVGQYIGKTDTYAAEPIERPVHRHEVMSTIYQHMGIDVASTTLRDSGGRPHFLVDAEYRKPVAELL